MSENNREIISKLPFKENDPVIKRIKHDLKIKLENNFDCEKCYEKSKKS